MRLPCWLLTVIFFLLLATTSMSAARQQNAAEEGPADKPTYKELMEHQEERNKQQEERNKQYLEMQSKLSERAIQGVVQEQQIIQIVTAIGGVLLLAGSTIFGLVIRQQFKRFSRLNKKVNIRLQEIKLIRNGLQSSINQSADFVKQLQKYKEDFEHLKESIQAMEDSTLKDLELKVRLATRGLDLLSLSVDERLRGAQGASEIAGGEQGAVALPLLLGILRRHSGEDPSVVTEALYGIGHRGKEVMQDSSAIQLILDASRSVSDQVRRQAVETIGKIGLTHPDFQQRLKECAAFDQNDLVRGIAEKILSDNNLT